MPIRDQKDYGLHNQACKPVSDLISRPAPPESSPVAHVGTASVKSVTKQHTWEYEGMFYLHTIPASVTLNRVQLKVSFKYCFVFGPDGEFCFKQCKYFYIY